MSLEGLTMFKKSKFILKSLLLLSTVVTTNVSATELESMIPTTLTGKLNYATLNYWVDTPDGHRYELLINETNEPFIMDKVGEKITLNGAVLTYSDKSQFFQPKFERAPQAKPLILTKGTNDDAASLYLDSNKIYTSEEYVDVGVEKEFPISNGKVSLVWLSTGGTACPAMFMYVVARQNSLPLMTSEFGNCSDIPTITNNKKEITVSLPGNPAQTWAFDLSDFRLYEK
ncbi:hypothetical protein UA31_16520 [Photobacterium angustum]|uniref:Uncharacterized protein n=2 Tax=Photobacterium angustum TaxID=661 RepID=A0A855SBV5_PHOAN|nr:hypothetical protein UB36_16515 [Photobacterium damselae subsp. damselae]KJG37833.1 hypothetical protein UA35_16375 [Photobacterium angustum]KJG44026.1 hypothetical protein UA31_16520 [Photobacterium angustum]KJG47166.1 hypothetical protein UA30_16420 [Photobacterium angustum]KJG51211.1 hypothetical protein UA34_20390 [Photobacterium angustum]